MIFDLDGTIVDAPYDWKQIKAELRTEGKPILSFIHSLDDAEKAKKLKILEKYEKEATSKAILKEGMWELLDFLSRKGIKKTLVTNNSESNVFYLMKKFNLDFEYVISRESGLWKPSGAPFVAVLKKLKLKREECCVVGDSHFDVKAAIESGIEHIFILKRDEETYPSVQVELFSSVKDLQKRIESMA